MRLADLSTATGVPVPTIKFYQRAGLLPRGHGSGAAAYDQTHVDRLHLVRALTDLGGLSLHRVRAVLAAVEVGDVSAGLDPLLPPVADDAALPLGEVDAFLAVVGLEGAPGPARRVIARALLDLRRAGLDVDASVFRPHVRAAAWLVSEESEAAGEGAAAALLASMAFGAALEALRVATRVSSPARG